MLLDGIILLLNYMASCLQETKGEAKLSDVSAALSVPLQQDCGCSLSVQQNFFSCLGTTDSQTVVFLAELSYSFGAVDMPSLLTSWVTSTPYVIVDSTQLQVDPTCPVVIDSLEPERCPVASVLPPTGQSTLPSADPSSNPATDSPTDATVIVIVVAVTAVVLLVMVMTILP